jgi:hypothetical protein
MKNSKSIWTAEALLELGRGYQAAAVFGAAADLNLFRLVSQRAHTAIEISSKLQSKLRGVEILLDALAALGLLAKKSGHYSLASGLAAYLTDEGSQSVLGMARHQANCLRNWAQLGMVVKTGRPAPKLPSVRGIKGDQESFITAMHNISVIQADEVIRAIQPLRFQHLLDIGGASGTWTMAFLKTCPTGLATLFDLPHVIPMARKQLTASKMQKRVKLVAGDFMCDPLPQGADLAWVSAIVHQNSRAQNRSLFANVFQALISGGRIAIRDIIMEESHTSPPAGALFAINMLVATPGGGTFTFGELKEDLAKAGFIQARVARSDVAMNGIVVATKP